MIQLDNKFTTAFNNLLLNRDKLSAPDENIPSCAEKYRSVLSNFEKFLTHVNASIATPSAPWGTAIIADNDDNNNSLTALCFNNVDVANCKGFLSIPSLNANATYVLGTPKNGTFYESLTFNATKTYQNTFTSNEPAKLFNQVLSGYLNSTLPESTITDSALPVSLPSANDSATLEINPLNFAFGATVIAGIGFCIYKICTLAKNRLGTL